MRSARLFVAVLAGGIASAAAADAAPYFDWAGPHVGVQAGGTWATSDAPSVGIKNSLSGGFAGGNIGYDFVLKNNWVAGLEADAAYRSMSASGSGTVPYGIAATYDDRQTLGAFGTVRGRFGYAFGPTLVYATGGWAWGLSSRSSVYSGYGRTLTATDNPTLSGWTIGGGIEHALTANVVARLQYLYIDYGKTTYAVTGYGVPVRLTTSAASLGINFKF